mgnify:CR=1 FL=1
MEEIEHEMKVIADSGIEEILMLTGETNQRAALPISAMPAVLPKNISEMWVLKFIVQYKGLRLSA